MTVVDQEVEVAHVSGCEVTEILFGQMQPLQNNDFATASTKRCVKFGNLIQQQQIPSPLSQIRCPESLNSLPLVQRQQGVTSGCMKNAARDLLRIGISEK